jgi:hypothetical protein
VEFEVQEGAKGPQAVNVSRSPEHQGEGRAQSTTGTAGSGPESRVRDTAKLGMDSDRLARISTRMKEFVQGEKIAGAVMVLNSRAIA